MSDFAASAMMRLIQAGLKRQRIAVASPRPERAGIDARLPLADKRSVLAALQSAHGLDCLLRIGEGIDDIDADGDEAMHTALLLADDPIDLLERWQRLERFIHSRHRVAFTPIGDRDVLVRHFSLDSAASPLPAENALVVGLLVLLMERVGAINLRARPTSSRLWTRAEGHWRALSQRESRASLAEWTIQWSGDQRQASSSTALTEQTLITKKLTALIARDPTRSWTLANFGQASLISSRTLQRRLHREGTTFQRLLRQSRVALAAKLLATGDTALAEIGYRSGFADQAHFQREFRTATAMTPGEYRALFLSRTQ